PSNRISRWRSTKQKTAYLSDAERHRGWSSSTKRMGVNSPIWKSAATLTTCSTIQNVSLFISPAARDSSILSAPRQVNRSSVLRKSGSSLFSVGEIGQRKFACHQKEHREEVFDRSVAACFSFGC